MPGHREAQFERQAVAALREGLRQSGCRHIADLRSRLTRGTDTGSTGQRVAVGSHAVVGGGHQSRNQAIVPAPADKHRKKSCLRLWPKHWGLPGSCRGRTSSRRRSEARIRANHSRRNQARPGRTVLRVAVACTALAMATDMVGRGAAQPPTILTRPSAANSCTRRLVISGVPVKTGVAHGLGRLALG